MNVIEKSECKDFNIELKFDIWFTFSELW